MIFPWNDLEYLKSQTNKPAYFGLGFIQLKISDRIRFHYYDPSVFPIVDENEYHNHRYNFTSFVVHGRLDQDIVVPQQRQDGDYYHTQVSCSPDDSGKSPKVLNRCNVIKLCDMTLEKGSSYRILKTAFHQVAIDKPTVTVLVRDTKNMSEFAEVLRPIDAPAVCPFSKTISEPELWEIVEKIVKS